MKKELIGEHFSVGEELLSKVSEFELKCKSIEKSVNEGYYSLNEALEYYKIKEIDFLSYIKKNKL